MSAITGSSLITSPASLPARSGVQASASPASTPSTVQGAAKPATSPGGETADQAVTRAQAAAQAKRFGEAAGICADILAQTPDYAPALALQGIVAALTDDPDRGVALLSQAVRLRPGNAGWHAHLASLCRITYRLQDAVAAGNESIRLDPNNADHLVNLSLVYVDVEDHTRAMACLIRALGLRHDHADGHLAMAQNLLAAGEFGPGWIEYEWRNLTEAGKATMPAMTSAPWNGMRIPNGRLLLVGDQGYGDTIQFARYIGAAAARCQELIVGCSAEMGPLLQDLPGVKQYHHRWNEVPGHAAHCRLSSLPYLFGTTPDTIPSQVPYLAADPARIAHWRARLDDVLPPGLPRVGLAWTGRPTHPNDRRRSIPLETLLPLTQAGPVAFVSLQKPMPSRDLPMLSRFNSMIDLADDLTDFGETAAVMENLDLVITVDTAMGHLAGALAKPVWIMLARTADWRWMLDRTDSPWYPTARLFRQASPGAWGPLVTEITGALVRRLRAPEAARAAATAVG